MIEKSHLDVFGKKNVGEKLSGKIPFSLKIRITPLRLSKRPGETADLNVELKNVQTEALMTSVVVKVPKAIGFDQTGISDTREIRLGYLKPEEERTLTVPLYSHVRTKEGVYDVSVTAYAHYRDYAHYLNSIKKTLEIRVV